MHGLTTIKRLNDKETGKITWKEEETLNCGCIKKRYGFKNGNPLQKGYYIQTDDGSGQGSYIINYCKLHKEKEELQKRLKEIAVIETILNEKYV